MHQAAQALSLLPPSSPSLSVDHEFAHEATAIHPRATGSDGIFRPTDAARGLASSPLQAIEALEKVGAIVAGVAVVVDRQAPAKARIEEAGYEYRYAIGLADLGLDPQ